MLLHFVYPVVKKNTSKLHLPQARGCKMRQELRSRSVLQGCLIRYFSYLSYIFASSELGFFLYIEFIILDLNIMNYLYLIYYNLPIYIHLPQLEFKHYVYTYIYVYLSYLLLFLSYGIAVPRCVWNNKVLTETKPMM